MQAGIQASSASFTPANSQDLTASERAARGNDSQVEERCNSLSSFADSLSIKVSETREERAAAFQLVHRVYRRAGLAGDNATRMRVLKHHLLDTTDVLVAQRAEQIVFTLTLIRDGKHGLPSESLFSEQIGGMRSEGLCLAEVSCAASCLEDENKKERFETLVRMLSLTAHAARLRGVDRLLLAVHPRHAKIYQRLFGCVACSGVEQYAAVQGSPAVLCAHDFAAFTHRRYPLYDQIYGPSYSTRQLAGMSMSPEEKEYFRQAVSLHGCEIVPMAA